MFLNTQRWNDISFFLKLNRSTARVSITWNSKSTSRQASIANTLNTYKYTYKMEHCYTHKFNQYKIKAKQQQELPKTLLNYEYTGKELCTQDEESHLTRKQLLGRECVGLTSYSYIEIGFLRWLFYSKITCWMLYERHLYMRRWI